MEEFNIVDYLSESAKNFYKKINSDPILILNSFNSLSYIIIRKLDCNINTRNMYDHFISQVNNLVGLSRYQISKSGATFRRESSYRRLFFRFQI